MERKIKVIQSQLKNINTVVAEMANKSDDELDRVIKRGKEDPNKLQARTSELYELNALINECIIHIKNHLQ